MNPTIIIRRVISKVKDVRAIPVSVNYASKTFGEHRGKAPSVYDVELS
jgi:hypothetical protein